MAVSQICCGNTNSTHPNDFLGQKYKTWMIYMLKVENTYLVLKNLNIAKHS